MVIVAAAVFAVACRQSAPAAIVADDSVIVNGRLPTALPVRVLDASGRVLSPAGLRYDLLSGSRLTLSQDGRVTCEGMTDSRVRVSLGALATEMLVFCRPVRGLYQGAPIELVLGGESRELRVRAKGVGGEPVMLYAVRARVRDTSVAVISGGRLHARRPGTTSVEIEVGDCATELSVHVFERTGNPTSLLPNQEFVGSLRLARGELRYWRVAPGRYELRLDLRNTNGPGPVLAAHDASCAPYPTGGQHYSCVAAERAAVVVRNPRGAERAAVLLIRRLTEPERDGRASASTHAVADPARVCPTVIE